MVGRWVVRTVAVALCTALAGLHGYERLFTDPTITWTRNVWHQSHGSSFTWNDDYHTLAQWHALGHDS